GSARVNKDQHNSANPTPDLATGELKQHGRSEFDYSTATESGWEPKGRVIAPPSLAENTQLLAHLVRCRTPHEQLQLLESEFALAAHLRLPGTKARLAPSCSIRHDVSP
ncbi:hypothetical protein BHE74_00042707, partial [Ensete ventricosum]